MLELEGSGVAAYCFKTIADPHVGKLSLLRVFAGRIGPETPLVNERTHHKERVGQILSFQGREHRQVPDLGPGDIGAVPKLKDVLTGDVLADTDRDLAIDPVPLPAPVVSVAVEPKTKGDEEKMGQAFRRLAEEDPTLRLSRDERTSELIVSGLSQMHIEVTVERLKRRFGVEVVTHPPQVPYLEAIRRKSRAQGRYKKQTGGRGQFGDCHIELEPLPGARGLRVHRQDRRRRDPAELPARGRSRRPGDDVDRRDRRVSRRRRARDARGRQLPRRRQLGDGVQDRRLDGVQEGLRRGGSRCCSSP